MLRDDNRQGSTYSGAVTVLRRFLLDHRSLAVTIIAVAMALRILVPTGFMIGAEGGAITLEMCSGTGPMKMVMGMPGMEHHQEKSDHQGKEMPCAFSAIATDSLAATDASLLAMAIAFIIATTFRIDIKRVVRERPYLRPPLRGPPQQA